MELKIIDKKEEPLLSRTRVEAEITFEKTTPSREEIKSRLVKDLGKDEKLIVVKAEKENFTQARFASLDKNIIQPLERWNFISVEKLGRNRVIKITEEGNNAAKFLI